MINDNMTVVVTGVGGQTSSYLVKILLKKGYNVIGTTRDSLRAFPRNLLRLGIDEHSINYVTLNPSDPRQVFSLLFETKPSIVFNLAGQTSVALSFSQPAEAIESISISCLNFLEAIRVLGLSTRYFNAGSSECFGNTGNLPADETSSFKPTSPYSIAKISAIHLTAMARSAYNIFACSGILSNHESPLRPSRFVTRKIIGQLIEVKNGQRDGVHLGNINVVRDWGWAPEYAEAIFKVATSDNPQDYVIATGESHSLREFVEYTCSLLHLNFHEHVFLDDHILRPLELLESRLDPTKIKNELGWYAKTKFSSVIENLVAEKLY